MFIVDLAKYAALDQYHSKLSTAQIRAMQQRKFTAFVKFAAERSPYYRDLIRTHHIDITHCTPEDFPILTKAIVLKHFDQIVTDPRITKAKIANFLEKSKDHSELYLNKYIVVNTSGSSGMVGYFLYTPKELAAGLAHFTRMNAPKLGQKLAYIGAINGHFAGFSMISAAKRIPFIYKEVRMFDINQSFPDIIKQLNELQPTSIAAYALALRKLAEAQEAGELHIRPKFIESSGEPLSDAAKSNIEKVFQTEVVNVYATSEHLLMGIGKDAYGGMYLMEDNLIFEHAPTYTRVTNLYNKSLPLIRYQMSDRLQVIPDKQKRLPFTKVSNIVGRNEYVPIFLNDKGEEDFISPILLIGFYVKGVSEYQFHLKGNRSFIFKACLDKHLSDHEKSVVLKKIEQGLRTLLKEKHMTKVDFDIEEVDSLWADPKTGKFRMIVKEQS